MGVGVGWEVRGRVRTGVLGALPTCLPPPLVSLMKAFRGRAGWGGSDDVSHLCGRDAEGGWGDSQDGGGPDVYQGTKWKRREVAAQRRVRRGRRVEELIPKSHRATLQDFQKRRAHAHWDSLLL